MLLFKEESYAIIGICLKVHKKLGVGFLESVYQEVIEKEFLKKKIPYQKQKRLQLYYDGTPLQKHFIADFVCYDKIIIEIKSVVSLQEGATKQTVNHLKATNFKLGLLINFGESRLNLKRIINTAITI